VGAATSAPRLAHQTAATTDETIKSFSYGDEQPTPPPTGSKGKATTATRNNKLSGARTVAVKDEYQYGGPAGLPSARATTISVDSITQQTLTQTYPYSTFGDLETLDHLL